MPRTRTGWFGVLSRIVLFCFTVATFHPASLGVPAALDFQFGTSEAGSWTLDFGLWTLDLGPTPAYGQDANLTPTPDADSTDPFIVQKAQELGNDPAQLFAFVRDQIGYESYTGSLRGARGTLWSKAGNGLDQASLLIALLRTSGVPARYVQGTLPDNLAQELILSMFPAPLRVVGCLDPGTAVADPANDLQLLGETRAHFWVQFGAGFQDADPTFARAQIGQTFAASQGTFTEVPDNLRHKVTLRLERELTTPAVSLFGGGSAQSMADVLEQTFNTVELVGRPVSLGHFVNTSTLGFVFSSTTITYSPYVVIGELGSDGTRDELIRGSDYQDVLTNFPFGSQIVTGVFLAIDLQSPDGSVKTFERTLADRIGFVARRTGTGGSLVGDPTAAALIDPLDITTISIMPSGHFQPALDQIATQFEAMSDEYEAFFTMFAATPEGPAREALLPRALELSTKAFIATARGRLAFFERQSEFSTAALEDLLLARSYWDHPRITIVTSDVTATASTPPTLALAIDLRENNPRVLPFPGQAAATAVGFRMARGFAENGVEAAAMDLPLGVTGDEFRTPATTSRIFEAAESQGIAFVVLDAGNRSLLDTLAISDEAKFRIGDALDVGKQIIVPERSVPIAGRDLIGWFQQDLMTGETIGVLEDGGHQAFVEYFGTQLDVAARSAVDQFLFGILAGAATNSIAGVAVFLFGVGVKAALEKNEIGGAVTDIKQAVNVFIQILRADLTKALFGKPPLFVAGFFIGFNANIFLAADPPVGTSLLGSGPTAEFAALTGTNVAARIIPDPVFSVPFTGAQLPTVFRVGIKNTGAATDTFSLNFTNVPPGFTAQTSVPQITIPPGETAEVGICLRPTTGVPAPNTPAPFSIQVTSTTNAAITTSDTENFLVPEIHGVTLSSNPPAASTTPGTPVDVELTISSVGNVAETVTFDLGLPPGLSANGGLNPLALAIGQTTTQTLTLTPSVGTPLNSTLTATITASFGASEPQVLIIPVRVAVPGADAIADASVAAGQLGNTDLANRLNDLSIALTNLVQNPDSPVFKGQALANLDTVISQLTNDPALSIFVGDLTAARNALAAATTPAAIQTAVTGLGDALDAFAIVASGLARSNFEVFLLPNRQVAQPQVPATFEVRLHNIGTDTATYNLSLSGLPPGVMGALNQTSVTLNRDGFSSGIMATITQTSTTELLPFDFSVDVSVDGFPDISKSALGSFTVRNAFISVIAVIPDPPFADPGNTVNVSARLLNAVNQQQDAQVSYIVTDPNGQQVFASPPVPTTLTVQASLVTLDLGMLDTTGFDLGQHVIEVTVRDLSGTPIPGATGQGALLIGSPVTASLSIDPDTLPPGDGMVMNTLQIDSTITGLPPLSLLGQVPTSGAGSVVRQGTLAYICGGSTINIVEVSNPASPQFIKTFGTGGLCRMANDQLVTVTARSGSSLLNTYSLTDPLNPTLVGSLSIPYVFIADLLLANTHAFLTQIQFCFFLGSNDIYTHNGDLLSVNLSTPATPALADVLFNTNGDTSFDPTDVSGCAENGGESNVWQIVQADAQTLLLASTTVVGTNTQAGVGRIFVVDITDPLTLTVVRELQIPGTVQSLAFAKDGNLALVASSTGGWNDRLQVDPSQPDLGLTGTLVLTTVDLTDPRNPQIIASQPLNRKSRGLNPNLLALGNNLFAFSTLGGINDPPQIVLVNASDPDNLLVSQIDVPTDVRSLAVTGNLLYASSATGLLIYNIGDIPTIPITAQVQVSKNTGVAVDLTSFNIPPTAIITDTTFDTLVWEFIGSRTVTWKSDISDLQPGEARNVTLDTIIDFHFAGVPGQITLPPTVVSSQQILSIDPPTQTVQPGEAASYTLTVRNPTGVPVTYDLSVQGIPPEWVDLVASVMVPPDDETTVDLTLTSDPFAALTEYGFSVTATNNGTTGSVNASLVLQGNPILPEVDPVAHGVVVELRPSQGTAGQGTAAFFTVRVTNTGSETDTIVLAHALPPGVTGVFAQTPIEVPPGAGNFRDVLLTLTPQPGTAPGNAPFTVVAVSTTDPDQSDTDDGTLTVVSNGVDVSLNPTSGTPATAYQLMVTNTGQSQDTFDLAVGGPAGLVATLGVASVTLNPGASQTVPITLGAINFAFPGNLALVGTATSRGNSAVRDSATATVNISPTTGVDAAFDPQTLTLPAPGNAAFLLLVENTGNTEDSYMATIMSTSGGVTGSLIGLDGQPAQQVPLFRLPGLSTGAIVLNATLPAPGTGTVTVAVRSLTNGAIMDAATATVRTSTGPPTGCTVTCVEPEVVVDTAILLDANTLAASAGTLSPFVSFDGETITIDVGNRPLHVTSSGRISVPAGRRLQPPAFHGNSKDGTPNLVVKACALQIDEATRGVVRTQLRSLTGVIETNAFGGKTGDITLDIAGPITINGGVQSFQERLPDEPQLLSGTLLIHSQCEGIVTGPASWIVTWGDPGSGTITLRQTGEGNIALNGLVLNRTNQASEGNEPPVINVQAAGDVVIDGSHLVLDEFILMGTRYDLTSGLLTLSREPADVGQITVQAQGDIMVFRNVQALRLNRQNFASLATVVNSSTPQGGEVRVRSLGGRITVQDRALQATGKGNNGLALTELVADKDVTVSAPTATDSQHQPAVTTAAQAVNRLGQGGMNVLQSCDGNVVIEAGAQVLATGVSTPGTNTVTADNGTVTILGTVDPPPVTGPACDDPEPLL